MLKDLPEIIAGPMVRNVTTTSFSLWFVSQHPLQLHLTLSTENGSLYSEPLTEQTHKRIQIGEFAWINMIHLQLKSPLPIDQRIHYELLNHDGSQLTSLLSDLDQLTYATFDTPFFYVPHQIKHLLHGSCRKPHHSSQDGLIAVDKQIAGALAKHNPMPDLLIMTGDQVYIDDVAGATLSAIHQLIERLGLFEEDLPHPNIENSAALRTHNLSFYHREQLLPDASTDKNFQKKWIKGKKKPLFTSVHSKNHLMTLNEVLAMYLLVWSPVGWTEVSWSNDHIDKQHQSLFAEEKQQLHGFIAGLTQVRRALAHIPCYMIFDDHDVTDDWNLTRGWEEAAYGNPLAKRIIGNALIGYWLCQGWGNQPSNFDPILLDNQLIAASRIADQSLLIDHLLNWQQWDYALATSPPVMVLDSRTRRWRSESNPNKPSGLMDWEALCELQQTLFQLKSVILVSPAPIYGIKLIETIQRIFTFFGKALMVDAENWMAHKGTANVILNILRHPKTPQNFFILSGDVHYSFVSDVKLRFRKSQPNLVQFTASGIKNTFPEKLIHILDRMNQILYARYSPLNWLTQRRFMSVRYRRPEKHSGRQLLNRSGIGVISLNEDHSDIECKIIDSTNQSVYFFRKK